MWWAYTRGGLIFGGAYSRMFTVVNQSRSPSLRSSGRNVRLWDNPLPEARNPG